MIDDDGGDDAGGSGRAGGGSGGSKGGHSGRRANDVGRVWSCCLPSRVKKAVCALFLRAYARQAGLRR